MPTQYIHEDHMTFGDDLFFPNVQTCAAIIVQTDGSTRYGGYHITLGSAQAELDGACQYIAGALMGNVKAIYVIGNYSRNGATGVGANSTLANALRGALNTNVQVKYLQSPDSWMNGIAVRVQGSQLMPGVPEIRVAPPGQWNAAANGNLDANMRRVTRAGAVAMPRFPSMPTATFNGAPGPLALGSLENG